MGEARIYYEKDASLTALEGKTVGVIGYGNQGHGHAQNMRDSGLNVIVAARAGSERFRLAEEHGFKPKTAAEVTQEADLVIVTIADEIQSQVYEEDIAPNLRAGQTLGFCHGFNLHFKYITPPEDIDIIMIAPKGPGFLVRETFMQGAGVPCLVAVYQDATGQALPTALAWGRGIGGARAGILETTFKEETETDLFGEQAVLCGGMTGLIKAGFETLVDAGYQPEVAYFECLHESKLIIDLMYQGGLSYMRQCISNTAEYGDLTRGPRVVNDATKAEMKKILDEICTGKFAEEWVNEYKTGKKNFNALFEMDRDGTLEKVGRKLRKMMSWIEDK